MTYHYLLENSSGALVLENGLGYYQLEYAPSNMPNLVGMELIPATNALQAAGILVPALLINLEWPIQVNWVQSGQPYGIVLAQNPVATNFVDVNGSVILTVSEYPLGMAYP
jgi:beta-lactam-binding protein with PASTA domain